MRSIILSDQATRYLSSIGDPDGRLQANLRLTVPLTESIASIYQYAQVDDPDDTLNWLVRTDAGHELDFRPPRPLGVCWWVRESFARGPGKGGVDTWRHKARDDELPTGRNWQTPVKMPRSAARLFLCPVNVLLSPQDPVDVGVTVDDQGKTMGTLYWRYTVRVYANEGGPEGLQRVLNQLKNGPPA